MGTSHSLPPLHHHHGSFSNGYSAGSGFGLGISPGGTDMGLGELLTLTVDECR